VLQSIIDNLSPVTSAYKFSGLFSPSPRYLQPSENPVHSSQLSGLVPEVDVSTN